MYTLPWVIDQLEKRKWRWHVGMTPYWDRNTPKHLKKKPYEAYVYNGEPIGSKFYVFPDSDGRTATIALWRAYVMAVRMDKQKREAPAPDPERKRKR